VKPKYSVFSLLLATAIIALLLTGAGLLQTVWSLQRERTSFNQKIQSLDRRLADLRSQHENEYAGLHPSPLLFIDPHVEKASPWLLRISPSKYSGSGGKYWIGAPGEQSPKLREVNFELRLMRSLNDVDFYRLVYRVDGHPAKQVLFGYDGDSRLIDSSDSISFVIAPDKKSALETAIDSRHSDVRSRLKEAWTTGYNRPVVQNANSRAFSMKYETNQAFLKEFSRFD